MVVVGQPASGAACAQRAIMCALGLVAGIAVLGRAFVNVIGMAGVAGRVDVFPGQRVRSQRVVDGGLLPVGGVVALDTTLTQAALMFVVVLMARIAALWSSPERRNGLCPLVTLVTGSGGMLPQ